MLLGRVLDSACGERNRFANEIARGPKITPQNVLVKVE